jgi:uncharacterized protein YbjT (DUF2867 family)
MYVVAGVSGHTGKVAAESLLAQNRAVRVVVRDAKKGDAWKAKGADVAVADLGDPKALGRALQGTEGAYVLVPPSMTEPDFGAYQDRISDSIARATEESRVPHLVLLSSIGADQPSGTGPIAGLYRAEKKLSRLPATKSTFLRAGYFMENLAASLGTLGQGFIPSFIPATLPIDMIATVDIGHLVAKLLVEGSPAATQVVQLGGPPVTMNDVASALGRLTKKAVRVEEAPLDAVVPTFTSFGMTEDLAKRYREMLEGLRSGLVAAEAGQRKVAGTTPVEVVLRGLLGMG